MRHKLQAQLDQNLAESHCRKQEAQKYTPDVVAKLESLTQQLNAFRPMSESDAVVKTERISDSVNARLQLQSQRVDEMPNAVHEARKTSVDNAETMQEIRIAIENLGTIFRKCKRKYCCGMSQNSLWM